MTYLNEYQLHLEVKMTGGGTPDEMEQCVTEYNAAGRPDYKPSPAFKKWVHHVTFACTNCQGEFRVVPPAIPDAAKEVTCESCQIEAGTVPHAI